MQQIVFCILFLILTSIPCLDAVRAFLPRTKLHGLDNSSRFPRFKYADWKEGRYQARVEQWALKRPATWGWGVKLNNELTYRLFNQLTTDYQISVQAGNDGHLIQSIYYAYFNRYQKGSKAKVKRKIRRLKRLQDYFFANNVPMIGLISPNVFSLYPEVFPNAYRNPRLSEKYVKDSPSDYDYALQYIEEFNPHVLDGHKLLLAEKDNFPFRFFHPTASHWNDVASCLVTEEILRIFNQTWNRSDLPKLPCRDYEYRSKPHGDDLDLLRVANLLLPKRQYRPAPYVKIDEERQLIKKPIKVLVVGTSFLFAIQKQLIQNKIAEEVPIFFYFRSLRLKDRGGFRGLNKNMISWDKFISEYDGVIIESNVSNISEMGYGFIEAALKHYGE